MKIIGIDEELTNFSNDEIKKELLVRNYWNEELFCYILHEFLNTKQSSWNIIIDTNCNS